MPQAPAIHAANAHAAAALPVTAETTGNGQTREVASSFQVYDEQGRIWPPGFVSKLCDRASPLCVFTPGAQKPEVNARRAENKRGKGWGSGTIEHMAPAGYQIRQVPMMFGPRATTLIEALRSGPKTSADLLPLTTGRPHQVLAPAIAAGVVRRTGHTYSLVA